MAPEDITTAFREADVLGIFEKLAPSHRDEYVRWITDAKKPKTRERRIQRAIAMIAAKQS